MQSHHPRRHPNVFVQDLGRDKMLSIFDANQLHILNPTAYQIWQQCDGAHTPADIVERLAERFPHTPRTCLAADVEKTLAALSAKGLLQPNDSN